MPPSPRSPSTGATVLVVVGMATVGVLAVVALAAGAIVFLRRTGSPPLPVAVAASDTAAVATAIAPSEPPSPTPLPTPAAPARQGVARVSGGLPQEVVDRILRQSSAQVRRCYEAGLTSNPSLQGHVTVKFTINAAGSVVGAHDEGSDLASPGVIQCIVRAMSSLTFPQPEGGNATVVYPMSFLRGG